MQQFAATVRDHIMMTVRPRWLRVDSNLRWVSCRLRVIGTSARDYDRARAPDAARCFVTVVAAP